MCWQSSELCPEHYFTILHLSRPDCTGPKSTMPGRISLAELEFCPAHNCTVEKLSQLYSTTPVPKYWQRHGSAPYRRLADQSLLRNTPRQHTQQNGILVKFGRTEVLPLTEQSSTKLNISPRDRTELIERARSSFPYCTLQDHRILCSTTPC